jgi:hypothetical protein
MSANTSPATYNNVRVFAPLTDVARNDAGSTNIRRAMRSSDRHAPRGVPEAGRPYPQFKLSRDCFSFTNCSLKFFRR